MMNLKPMSGRRWGRRHFRVLLLTHRRRSDRGGAVTGIRLELVASFRAATEVTRHGTRAGGPVNSSLSAAAGWAPAGEI
jgi:hypothetical protein